MKEVILLWLVLNISYSLAIHPRRRVKRSWTYEYSEDAPVIEPYIFSQKLDHFSLQNDQQWDQVRYLTLLCSRVTSDQ